MKIFKYIAAALLLGFFFVSADALARKTGQAEDCPCWDPEGTNGIFQLLHYVTYAPDVLDIRARVDKGVIDYYYYAEEPYGAVEWADCTTGHFFFLPSVNQDEFPYCTFRSGLRVNEDKCNWLEPFTAFNLTGREAQGCMAAYQIMIDHLQSLSE